MSGPLAFRPGTFDESIFCGASAGIDYQLPERFEPGDIIIDIGMHIGGFCQGVLERGACRVHGFEAEAANFACARENLGRYGDRIRMYHKAVWRSDRRVPRLGFTPSTDPRNTGGGGMIFWQKPGSETEQVEAIRLDDLVKDVTGRGRERIRLLKIDCEGSEFPILLTARTLHLIDAIAGEFHEVGGLFDSHVIPPRARIRGVPRFTIEVLSDRLRRAGFEVSWSRHPDSFMGLFSAQRTQWPRSLRERLRALWPVGRSPG